MKRIVSAVAVLALIGSVSSAFAQGGPPHVPGYDDGEHDNSAYSNYRPMTPQRNVGFNAFFEGAPSAVQPAPNGTVNPYTGKQTNGY
jgi:hypothetical protein